MKKSLFALAALGAFASAAQAQSTVTLYGTFDTSVVHVTDLQQLTTTNFGAVTKAVTTGSGTMFIDSAFATSAWGMRGSEDLGGGRKANFYVEGDMMTNNGATHSSGIFRRGANVSLSDAALGEVFLGRRGSAYILATGQMLPVSGNTAHQWRSVSNSSITDQMSNSVTYATPQLMKTNVVVQYGLNNTIDNGDGTMFAAHFINRSINNLTISGAYNNQVAQNNAANATNGTVAAAAYNSNGGAPTGNNTLVSASTVKNQEGYAIGLKYKVTPTLEIASIYNHGRVNNGTAATAGTNSISTGQAIFGLGYQATPALLLGANYGQTTFQAKMMNMQAHYFMSKRTRIYSQLTLTQAAKGNYQEGRTSYNSTTAIAVTALAANSYSPISCNSNTGIVCASGLAGSAGSQNTPVNSSAINLGVIHSF
jgi:predicted porin